MTEADFQVAHWEAGNVYEHFLAPSTEMPVKSTALNSQIGVIFGVVGVLQGSI